MNTYDVLIEARFPNAQAASREDLIQMFLDAMHRGDLDKYIKPKILKENGKPVCYPAN